MFDNNRQSHFHSDINALRKTTTRLLTAATNKFSKKIKRFFASIEMAFLTLINRAYNLSVYACQLDPHV